MWSWSHSHKTAVWKPWRPPSHNHQHHQDFPGFWCRITWLENCDRQTPAEKNLLWLKRTEKLPANFKPAISVWNPCGSRFTPNPCTSPRKQPLQSFPICLPHQTQHRDCLSTSCYFCSTITGSFGRFRYYWSPNSSLTSQNCFWDQFQRIPVVSIISTRHCCPLLSTVLLPLLLLWCLEFHRARCWVLHCCLAHYSTFRHHSLSFGQPSATCRRHPTSKVNSTKQRTKPYTWCTDNIKSWMCSNQLKLNEDKTEAILFSTLSLLSDC